MRLISRANLNNHLAHDQSVRIHQRQKPFGHNFNKNVKHWGSSEEIYFSPSAIDT